MNSNVETQHAALDTLKLAVSLTLLVAGLGAFYLMGDVARLYRVLGLLATVGVAGYIASRTARGRSILGFAGEVQIEVRKVVWPTRQETLQTTLAVFVVVFIAAIILWLLDMLLAVLIKWLMG